MRITLPWPPSVNHYWRAVNGRNILSKDGREYRSMVISISHSERWLRFIPSARLGVLIVTYQPDNRRRDIDNILKAVLDAMGHAAVYDDDSQIDELSIARGPVDKSNPRVEVEIVSLMD